LGESDIAQNIRDFIGEHIESVLHLELLLLLYAQPQRTYTAEEVTRELRIDANWVAAQLAQLCQHGILSSTTDTAPIGYQYRPDKPELDVAVRGLAAAYAQRRVSVINLIVNKPSDKLRSFAEAFRFRKDGKDKDNG
jgi:predicted DNA-binding transcriptional regulator